MNIFEDLIDELKEENLIERTVIETNPIEKQPDAPDARAVGIVTESVGKTDNTPSLRELPRQEKPAVEKNSPPIEMKLPTEVLAVETAQNTAEDISENTNETVIDEAAFYRQRAIDEVSFLQMVEAAFAGVEREQLKIVPRPFDDLKVKKVLHSFLQVSHDVNSPEYSKAEFQLMKETESWYSSLSLRDMRVMTTQMRRYCETSRPPLSAPALIAMARFYRNSPYSEQVRSKFDLVLTRLFSKDDGGNRRESVFDRAELITRIQELYADWSSVPLYSTDENDTGITQIARKFEDFMAEAESARSFDELINSNFFNRLRLFKENSSENFYAPRVAALGIECNIRVGNLYVELLENEKKIGNVASLEEKYGLSHDQTISEATGKTLSLIELLKQKKAEPKAVEEKNIVVLEPINREEAMPPKKAVQKQPNDAVKSKKWMFSLAVLVFIAIIGIYLATKSSPVKVQDVSSVGKMNLENSMLKEYLSEAVIQDATLNGVVLPTWNHLTEEKKKDVLKQMLNFGGEKGYKKVQLVNKESKTVGTAVDGLITISD